MAQATVQSPDPTLAALVPPGSARRNLAWVTTGTVLLALAWFAPAALEPSIAAEGGGSGSWQALGTSGSVLTAVELTPHGWPSFAVRAVADVPGAQVVGAWVVRATLAEMAPVDEGSQPDALSVAQASFPGVDLAASSLPQTLRPGDVALLVIVWHVTDCTLLVEHQPAQVTLRSAVGTTVEETISDVAGPSIDLPTLGDAEVCPQLTAASGS